MKHVINILLLFYVCLIVCCTVGPDYEKLELYTNKKIVDALNLKPTSENKYNYKLFNDPVLNKLQELAFVQSPTIKEALSRVKQSRLLLSIAEVKSLPTFDVKGAYQYIKDSKNIGPVLNEDVYQVGIDAVWELDIFGGTRRNARMQAATTMQTIENLNNVYVSLASEIALTYVNYRYAQANKKIVNEQKRTSEKILENTKFLFNAGLISLDEVNKAISDVKKIERTLSDNENQLLQYETQLEVLTGQLPQSLKTMLSDKNENLTERVLKISKNKFFELPANIIENRPDVKAAEYALKAQNEKIGVAIANMFPKVSLSAMVGFESLHKNNLFDANSYTYSYQPTFSIPLFYFGQLKKQVDIEREVYNEKMAQYESSFLSAVSDIKNKLDDIENTYRQYHLNKESYEKFLNSYNLAQKRFNAGLIKEADMLSAKNDFLLSKNQLLESNVHIYQAIISFFKAIGTIS